jgi:hypothetical protein
MRISEIEYRLMLKKIVIERRNTPTTSVKIDSSSSLFALPVLLSSFQASQAEQVKPTAMAMGSRRSKVEPNA